MLNRDNIISIIANRTSNFYDRILNILNKEKDYYFYPSVRRVKKRKKKKKTNHKRKKLTKNKK